ncbi:cold-shock protein [Tistrella bauzanensis]
MSISRSGKVKFFDASRGFGFVHDGDDRLDRHFHVTQVVGADLPGVGDVVTFLPATGPRGPKLNM